MSRLLTLTTLLSTLSLLTPTIQARTDLAGCTSTATRNQWNEASVLWYVPGTGEICDFPDCGGGRAPPKYDNPACPGYTGTASYEPTYLPGFGKATATATATATASADGNADDVAPTGGASATDGTRPGVTGFVSATGGAGAGAGVSGSATAPAGAASSSAAVSPSGSSKPGVTKSASMSTSASSKTSSSSSSATDSVPTSNAAAGGWARLGGGVVGVVAGVVAAVL